MKILHYIPSIDRGSGGVGSYMQQLSSELGKNVEMHIVTHKSDDYLPILNSELHFIPDFSIRSMGYYFKKEWMNCLKSINPDVVQVNGCWRPSTALAIIWAKKNGYKVVLCPHGMLEPWDIKKNYWTKKLPALLLYQKRAIKMVDSILATSEAEKRNLINLGYNKSVSVIPNGIEIDQTYIKKSWKINKQLFFLALLRKNKGADILINAVAKLRNEIKGYKVIIAGPVGNGEESYVSYLHDLVKLNKLDNMIVFLGGLYGIEKWNYYQESDIFVLPTLNENFGIVIAESLLAGTPVITCKGAPWPQLESEKIGWWVNRNVDSVANAISEAIRKTPEELEEMGKRGRSFVVENYSSKKIAEDYLKMYISLNIDATIR